jgi:hypothetical protein
MPTLQLNESSDLVNELQKANQESLSLQDMRDKARQDLKGCRLEEGFLLYQERLVVPDENYLRTKLIREAHDQVSSAHPGRLKTYKLLSERYYCPNMRSTSDQYVGNCHKCTRAMNPRDRKPGFLHPLPIPNHPLQHISMDFKSCPRDVHGYDAVFVVMDRLSQQAISIPCFKTTTARDTAVLYINIYRWRGVPDSSFQTKGLSSSLTFGTSFAGF